MGANKRQQVLTILALTVVAIWAGDKMVLSPLTASWKSRAAEITRLDRLITQGTGVVEREQRTRERWNEIVTNTLPKEQSVAQNQVLKAFDRWSQDARISVTSVKPTWKVTGDDYTSLECRVDAFGNLETVTKFLYAVEKDPMALKIDLVELTSRDKDGSQVTLGLQVNGLVLDSGEQ